MHCDIETMLQLIGSDTVVECLDVLYCGPIMSYCFMVSYGQSLSLTASTASSKYFSFQIMPCVFNGLEIFFALICYINQHLLPTYYHRRPCLWRRRCACLEHFAGRRHVIVITACLQATSQNFLIHKLSRVTLSLTVELL